MVIQHSAFSFGVAASFLLKNSRTITVQYPLLLSRVASLTAHPRRERFWEIKKRAGLDLGTRVERRPVVVYLGRTITPSNYVSIPITRRVTAIDLTEPSQDHVKQASYQTTYQMRLAGGLFSFRVEHWRYSTARTGPLLGNLEALLLHLVIWHRFIL